TITRYLRSGTGLERVVIALVQPSTFIAFFEAAGRDILQGESALELNVSRTNGDLAFHFTGDGAVVSKSQIPYDEAELGAVNARLRSLVSQTAIGSEDAAELRGLGQHIFDSCFSEEVKAQLAASDQENLLLRLDEEVMHIPWELAHDGHRFLSRRFNLGRQVVALQATSSTDPPPPEPPRRFLVVHDPTGDLPGAEREARLLLSHFDACSRGSCSPTPATAPSRPTRRRRRWRWVTGSSSPACRATWAICGACPTCRPPPSRSRSTTGCWRGRTSAGRSARRASGSPSCPAPARWPGPGTSSTAIRAGG
ncbi:MAG: CHAT domain-containing protein, partial [Armatimonadetes bacterium]|nr:CHAT domain-containing protein [Armatimonadota bacterium]